MLKKISSSEAWFPDGYCHYVTMSMPRRIRKFHLKNCILSLPPRLLDLETQKTEKEKKREISSKKMPPRMLLLLCTVFYISFCWDSLHHGVLLKQHVFSSWVPAAEKPRIAAAVGGNVPTSHGDTQALGIIGQRYRLPGCPLNFTGPSFSFVVFT